MKKKRQAPLGVCRSWLGNVLKHDRAVTHARGGRDGGQEGCESGYYDLHRYLNNPLLHTYY